MHTEFWWLNLRGRDHLEGLDVDKGITLKYIFHTYDEGVDWIDLAKNRNGWRAVVSTAMNLLFPQNAENFLNGWGSVIFSRRTLLHRAR